jgi:hypothetical protein
MEKRNMKGFIFTLDAIFALVIATAGIAVMAYIGFSSTSLYSAPLAQASGMLQNLLLTTVSSATQGSKYASYLNTSASAQVYDWPQFGHDQLYTSSTGFAPQSAYWLYNYNASQGSLQIPAVIVSNGTAAFVDGHYIDLINAATGKNIRQLPFNSSCIGFRCITPRASIIAQPAMYNNMLIYGDSTNTIRSYFLNGTSAWNYTAFGALISPIEIVNNYVAFGTSRGMYLLNASNGTLVAHACLSSCLVADAAEILQAPVYTNGAYITVTKGSSLGTQNYVYSYAFNGSALNNIWTTYITGGYTTQPVSIGNTVAVGSGNRFYILSLGGNVTLNTTLALGVSVIGVAAYSGNYYVESNDSISEFSSSTGDMIGQLQTPYDYQNSTPTVGSGTIYTLINGNTFLAYNSSTFAPLWNITLATQHIRCGIHYRFGEPDFCGTYSQVTLAEGNIYVPVANTIYVFGTYKPQPGDNMLQTLGSMYLNNQGDYASIMMQDLYGPGNTGLFIALGGNSNINAYAPDLQVSTFNSLNYSYIQQSTGERWPLNNSKNFSMSIWIYPTASRGVVVDRIDAAGSGGSMNNSVIELDPFKRIGSGGSGNAEVYMSFTNSSSCTGIGSVLLNKWSNIVITYNGSNQTETGYINGVWGNSYTAGIFPAELNGTVFYALGLDNSSSDCGAASYFNGSMLNYQIYNDTLTNQQIEQVSQSGAFGNPVGSKNNVSLWWPLDGNPNDFSGRFDFGMQHNVTYNLTSYEPQSLLNSYQISKASAPTLLNISGTYHPLNVSVVEWR